MTHVDEAVLAQMRDGGGALTPAVMLEADDHLAGCDSCRARLRSVIAADSAHLGSDAIAALAAGAGSLEAQSHLSGCRECADAVQSLMSFAKEVEAYRSGPRRMVGRVAAGLAAAIVVASGAWWISRGARPTGGDAGIAAVDAAPDSAWISDALHGVPLRGLSAAAAAAVADDVRRAAPKEHLLIGVLEEQAGHRERAIQEYRALLAEHPGSAEAAQLLARVERRP